MFHVGATKSANAFRTSQPRHEGRGLRRFQRHVLLGLAGAGAIVGDASWARPPSGLPGPAELLASAFAACLLKNVERVSKLLPFRYEAAEVDVTARRQDRPPKFTEILYELRLVTAPDHRVELLHATSASSARFTIPWPRPAPSTDRSSRGRRGRRTKSCPM